MKSEARHELDRNDLAEGLTGLPRLWQRHGNKLLIVLAAAFLVLAAVRYRNAQAVEREQQTRQALAEAWDGVQQLPRVLGSPASAALESQINQAVERVTADDGATPTQAAWAWLARGELYWQLSQVDAPTPASQPASAPASQPAARSKADTLDLAAKAYGQVVTHYTGVAVPVKVARFSLAAVAEEKHDLAAARQQYKALIETDGLPAGDKAMATARLGKIDLLEKPVLLLPATQPAAATPSAADLLPAGMGPLNFGPTPTPTSTQAPAAAPLTSPATLPSR